MIEHLVWFKLTDEMAADQKQAMLADLCALPGQIEGIEHLACGEDFSGRSQGFQIGLVVRFSSREAFDKYGPHPVHQAFVTQYKPFWAEVRALDFEA